MGYNGGYDVPQKPAGAMWKPKPNTPRRDLSFWRLILYAIIGTVIFSYYGFGLLFLGFIGLLVVIHPEILFGLFNFAIKTIKLFAILILVFFISAFLFGIFNAIFPNGS